MFVFFSLKKRLKEKKKLIRFSAHSIMLQRDNHSPSDPLICPSCNKKFTKRQAADHIKETHFKLKSNDSLPVAREVFLYDSKSDDAYQASTSADAALDKENDNGIILSFLLRDRSMPTVSHLSTSEVPVAPPPPHPPLTAIPVPPQTNPLSNNMLITFCYLEPNLCYPV